MPLPITKDVGKIMDALEKEDPNMPLAQRRAIAIERAKKAGAKIPEPQEVVNILIEDDT